MLPIGCESGADRGSTIGDVRNTRARAEAGKSLDTGQTFALYSLPYSMQVSMLSNRRCAFDIAASLPKSVFAPVRPRLSSPARTNHLDGVLREHLSLDYLCPERHFVYWGKDGCC